MNENQKQSVPRRSFLTRLWQGLGALAALEFIGVSFAFLVSGRKRQTERSARLVKAGNADDFDPGSVTVFRNGLFYLCRLKDGGFLALSLSCTHLGCSVNWQQKSNRFLCPCHASAFDMVGNVINPPAARALDLYPVRIENGVITVDISRRIRRKRFKKKQVTYV